MEVRRSSLLFTRNAVVTMVLRDVSQNLTKRKSAPWRVVEAEIVTFPIPVTMSDGSNEGEGFEFGSQVWGISVSYSDCFISGVGS